jgi:hypothetical protein
LDDDYHNEILTASWEHDGTRWNSQLTIGYYADAHPPWIETPIQNPPDNVTIEQEVKISANITDLETGIKNATLYYSTNNGTSWTPIEMQYNATTKLYETIYPIPAQPLDTCVLYKITAYDNAENQYTEDNAGSYYVYSVIPEYTMLLPLLFMTATLIAFALTRTRKKP